MSFLNTSRLARVFAVAVILAACVGCDQYTKSVAQAELKGRPGASYLGDVFRLQYAENPGAFLGLGGQMPEMVRRGVLVGINCLIAVSLAGVVLFSSRMTLTRIAGCALLLAGAVGNLIDRVRGDGLVIDFMNMGLGPLRTGIFNVSDVAIMLGAILLLVPLAKSQDSRRPPIRPTDSTAATRKILKTALFSLRRATRLK